MPEELQDLVESTPLVEAASGVPSSRRFEVRLIESDIWGACGYYSADVLQEAATRRVFAEGTQCFLDHPTAQEEADRPERSLRDLAGRLVTDAVMGTDGLYAEVEVFAPMVPVVEGMADAIGMSIRASGTAEPGEAAGRQGMLITSLIEARSVDFVTKAGAGGKIIGLLESARGDALTEEVARAQLQEARNVGQWIESRLHLSLTQIADDMFGQGRLTREERIALSSAVGDGLTAFTSSLETASPQLYTRDLWEDPDADLGESNPPNSDPLGESDTPTDPAADPADAPPDTPIQEDHMTDTPGGGAATPTNPRQVLEQGLAETRKQVAILQARDRARVVIAEALSSAWLPASTVARLASELIENLPMANDALDEAVLRDRATAKRDIAETEMAEALKAAGVGTVQGFGTSTNSVGGGVDVAAVETSLEASFIRMGMTESAAKIAAKGRV